MNHSVITIQLVTGGYVLTTPVSDDDYKTEVFTSTAKLNKAVRAAVEEYTLVVKTKADVADAE
jgi:hypothetical protein